MTVAAFSQEFAMMEDADRDRTLRERGEPYESLFERRARQR